MTLEHDWFPRPLPANVVMGERSWCYSSFAWLHCQSRRPCGVKIGHDSGLYHGTFFELGPEGEVEIGNYCTLVGAIIATNGRVVVGDYTFIAHEVVLADSFAATPPLTRPSGTFFPSEPPIRRSRRKEASKSKIGNRRSEMSQRLLTSAPAPGRERGAAEERIVLGENCWVAARAVLLAGTRIGADSIVGAGAVVDFEVPPGVIVAGNPARIVGPAR